MRFWISLFSLFLSLHAMDIDRMYKSFYDTISSSLRKIDIYLSDNNASIKQRFSIRTSIDTIMETKRETKFKFNIDAHLEFPRTQKKLYLFLQDYKKRNSIDEISGNSLGNSVEQSNFLLGLQYLSSIGISYKAGVKFHKITPDPFAALGWEHTFYFPHFWIYVGDHLSYYARRHLDNTLFAYYQYKFSPKTIFSFENSYRYEQRPDASNQYNHAIKLYNSLSKYEIFTPRAEIYLDSFAKSPYMLQYYYLGFDYQNRFFRDWLFYKLSPAILWRRENGFAPSYRLMVRFGITFERN